MSNMLNKLKQHYGVLLLPLLTVIISILINLEKYSDSYINATFNVLLQSTIIYGLLAVFRKWLLIRIVIAFFIVTALFVQLTYDAPLSVGVVMSILNSSTHESLSFIQFNFAVFILSFLFFFGMSFFYIPPKKNLHRLLLVVGVVYLVTPTLASSNQLLASSEYKFYIKTGMARGHSELFTTIEYLVQDMSYRFPLLASIRGVTDTISLMSKKTELSSTWSEVYSDGSAGLLVIGIGESLRAGNLGVYGYGRNTTPRLSELSNDLAIYKHAYSAGVNTWGSVPTALTLAGMRADLSKSIINLAKDAGFETYWFSNQARFSQWDFSVSSIAEQADHVYFSSDEEAGADLDSILIEKLSNALKASSQSKKRLIVLHFYGSHTSFSDRYPPEYEYFNGKNKLLDEYDNSVLYTDFVQSRIINIVAEHGGKYLFFADHGLGDPEGDVPLKHDVRRTPDIDSLKVPLIVYPKEETSVDTEEIVSLYYFECFFSEWSGISAAELRNGYCDAVFDGKKVDFVDSNLVLHTTTVLDGPH